MLGEEESTYTLGLAYRGVNDRQGGLIFAKWIDYSSLVAKAQEGVDMEELGKQPVWVCNIAQLGGEVCVFAQLSVQS